MNRGTPLRPLDLAMSPSAASRSRHQRRASVLTEQRGAGNGSNLGPCFSHRFQPPGFFPGHLLDWPTRLSLQELQRAGNRRPQSWVELVKTIGSLELLPYGHLVLWLLLPKPPRQAEADTRENESETADDFRVGREHSGRSATPRHGRGLEATWPQRSRRSVAV